MYMIHLITIYDVVNIFSMKNYESLRKLRVGVKGYTDVNWYTTTSAGIMGIFADRGSYARHEFRLINLSLSQYLKDGCIDERQMA